VGDGLHLTALPLLAVTVSDDPLAVPAVASVAYLPWLAGRVVLRARSAAGTDAGPPAAPVRGRRVSRR
jgi:hypothetical protein